MSTVADYTGRTVDVLAWDWSQAVQFDVLLTPALALPGAGGKIIGGIGKLVQRFLLELLTESASMPFAAGRGCMFITMLRTGQFRTILDVDQAFGSAVIDIQRNLLLDQTDSDPLDERFGKASLMRVVINGTTLAIYISIVSQAATQVSVLLPLTTTLTGGIPNGN